MKFFKNRRPAPANERAAILLYCQTVGRLAGELCITMSVFNSANDAAQADPSVLQDAAWRVSQAATIAVLTSFADSVIVLTVPTAARSVHRALVAQLEQVKLGISAYTRAIDEHDAAGFVIMQRCMEQSNSHGQTAMQRLTALRAQYLERQGC